uniref:Uncharacterized protein n=1 Tax=Grammatophora oceanica TaxID=210454 RepID=A0A7S1VSM2_9STRA|mmetsp:Transcript_6156/g.8854  ORF Transcript_6156/g.8854 Transcript_6156/m.8854 type:complete len:149 (+) Transcript_6156:134-580(+)
MWPFEAGIGRHDACQRARNIIDLTLPRLLNGYVHDGYVSVQHQSLPHHRRQQQTTTNFSIERHFEIVVSSSTAAPFEDTTKEQQRWALLAHHHGTMMLLEHGTNEISRNTLGSAFVSSFEMDERQRAAVVVHVRNQIMKLTLMVIMTI